MWALWLLLAVLPSSLAAGGERKLAILPGNFTLDGPAARQTLVLEEMAGGEAVGQVDEEVVFTSGDLAVARIEDGVALPVANGKTLVIAQAGGREAFVEVTVTGLDRPFQWSFQNHVQSVLTRAGCNSGACHGAAAGKNGFKLSLRGYDSQGDFLALTRQARGRRVVPGDPGRSLMLLKPTGAVPHKGGVRFAPESQEYRVLAEWIAGGTPPPRPDDPRVERIETLPARAVLKPGMGQDLIVRAHYAGGQSEEVTRWAKYTATEGSVAQVDEGGRVQVMGHGEGAVTVWYQSRIFVATISVPYENQVPDEVFTRAPRRNFIDELALKKLASLRLPPSPPASDPEFLRRAFLDTLGVLPTADEARAFLADGSAGKRDRLIESLFARPEFIDYWAYKWSDLLLVNSESLAADALWTYYRWIKDRVAAGTPWDRLVRELVTAKGSTLENGAANFYVLHQDPRVMSETVSVAFLGMSIGCARCHNHPMEKWTNDQYYGMASLFARVRAKEAPGAGNRVVFCATEGELVQPLTGKPQLPRPLEGSSVPFEAGEDRRIHLADWLTSPENPYFARAVANRVWKNFLGVGLVEAADDLRMTNPASNEELLSALAKHLVENRFDLKALMRAILQSATYQRSSQPLPENAADRRFYARYYPKRLMAEVLLDGLSQVTGVPTQFPGYPLGFRALELPDSNVSSYFLKSFGRPDRLITCECERTAEPSMAQALHIANGDTLNQKLEAKGGRIEKLLAAATPDEKLIEEAFLAALSRHPTEKEKGELLTELAGAAGAEKRLRLEDVFWGLLSSKEFVFNH